MLDPAQVEGIEEQLTVPSRNHPQLVDIWISIKRSSAGLDWEREFIALAARHSSKLSPAGSLQVIPFTERRGWIVARGVDRGAIAPAAVELLVRRVVAEANGNLAAILPPKPAIASEKAQDSWTQRVRTVFANGTSLSRVIRPEPRSSEVDVAPHL